MRFWYKIGKQDNKMIYTTTIILYAKMVRSQAGVPDRSTLRKRKPGPLLLQRPRRNHPESQAGS